MLENNNPNDSIVTSNEVLSSDNIILPTPSKLSLKSKVSFSLDELNLEDTEDEYIGGMFPKGKLSVLTGESGKGKSWVLAAAALSITDGKEFLPTDSYEVKDSGRVLIIDTEGRIISYGKRVSLLGGTLSKFHAPGVPSKVLSYKNQKDRKLITDAIKLHMPELIIIDSIAAFNTVDENTSAVTDCFLWLIEIALEYNAAIAFTQLANKSETKEGKLILKSVRGFGGIGQYTQAAWAIDTPNPLDDKLKRLYQLKNNNQERDNVDYVFRLENDTITFSNEVIETKKSKVNKRLEVLKLYKDKQPAEVARIIQETLEPGAKLNSLTKWIANQR